MVDVPNNHHLHRRGEMNEQDTKGYQVRSTMNQVLYSYMLWLVKKHTS